MRYSDPTLVSLAGCRRMAGNRYVRKCAGRRWDNDPEMMGIAPAIVAGAIAAGATIFSGITAAISKKQSEEREAETMREGDIADLRQLELTIAAQDEERRSKIMQTVLLVPAVGAAAWFLTKKLKRRKK